MFRNFVWQADSIFSFNTYLPTVCLFCNPDNIHSMKKNSYSVCGGFWRNAKRALLTLAISSAALPASADVFQQIIDNVVARELSTSNVTSLVASAKTYMKQYERRWLLV